MGFHEFRFSPLTPLRTMQFSTPVSLSDFSFRLTPASSGLVLGSCFAEHIGQRLQRTLPQGQVVVNPFGVQYNPLSIAEALRTLMSNAPLADDTYFEGRDGLWHSWQHSGAFSETSREACIEKVERARIEATALLRQAQFLLVTFGTSRGYRLKENGRLVSNCHKEPAASFEEVEPTLEVMAEEWTTLLTHLRSFCPQLEILFTISPYRYAKYGLHASQLSKAKLLLLVDALQSRHKEVYYFPAYEIVIDELRDYRFFKADMLHPSEQAIDYVWERWQRAAFSPELQTFATERRALLRDLAHRPLHPDSEAHRAFAENLRRRLQVFEQKWGVSAN